MNEVELNLYNALTDYVNNEIKKYEISDEDKKTLGIKEKNGITINDAELLFKKDENNITYCELKIDFLLV